jgi:chaperone required for assembly of F1-ATPase
MKRFYKQAATEVVAGGYGIRLDGRAVKTPARAELVVPTAALASAIVGEWNAQGEDIDPRTMPLTGLANAALDRVLADPPAFARGLSAYAESDLTCYRADGPSDLIARQCEAWDPLLDWAGERYGVEFEIATGIMHRAQDDDMIERLSAAVRAYDPFRMVALHPLVTISGSLIIALAVAEGEIDVDGAFAAGQLDELWQVEQWGEDELAMRAREVKRADFRAAARFLALLVPVDVAA